MTNIQSRWLDIGQALFCEANTQLSSPNKLDWFAHLSSQLEHRICFILPAHGFKHKILINNYALLTGCEVKMTEYLCLYSPCLPLARLCSKKNWRQPSTLNVWNPVRSANDFCEKAKIFSRPRTKVTDVGATGHKAQPGLGQQKCKNQWGQYSAILTGQACSIK